MGTNLNFNQAKSWTELSVQERKGAAKSADTGSLALMYKPPVAEWMQEAIDKLAKFQAFDTNNWDDEGSVAIKNETFLAALSLLRELIHNIKLPKPNLIPGYKGDIIFLWARKGFEIKISVNSKGLFDITNKDCSNSKTDIYPDLELGACVNDLLPILIYKII